MSDFWLKTQNKNPSPSFLVPKEMKNTLSPSFLAPKEMKNTLPYITLKKTNKNPSSNTNNNHFNSPTMAPKPSRNSLSPKAPSFLSQTQTHRKIHPFYIKLKLRTQQAPQPPKP